MQATRLMPLIAILLLTPSVAAAQSRLFSFERGVDRPGHAYRVLRTSRRRTLQLGMSGREPLSRLDVCNSRSVQ